ncbi:MAG: nucleotide exchange factor GrpE [Acidothermaceae bacterium]
MHFDPATGAVSAPASGPTSVGPGAGSGAGGAAGEGLSAGLGAAAVSSVEVAQLRTDLAERTADLQRLQAEYANYRKRVERDREAVREFAVAEALSALLPVLDDIGRAREHGELEGGFKQVAESLEATITKLGLVAFGEPGEPFDPTHHDALMHAYSDDVTEPTAVQILQRGYSYGGRVVRPARVAVAEPTAPLVAEPEATSGEETTNDAGTSASDQ